MKKALPVLAVIAGVGLFFGWKFFGASAEIASKNASGHGWDDARPELVGKFRDALKQRFDGLDHVGEASNQISDCMTTAAITFLNGTDCSYLYNKTTTSEAEHLSSQEACFKKVGYENKEPEFLLACMKEKFPNDWKVMRSVLVKVFQSSNEKGGMPADKSKGFAECTVDGDIAILNASDCKLVDPAAKTEDTVIRTLDSCYERPEIKEALNAMAKKCAEDAK